MYFEKGSEEALEDFGPVLRMLWEREIIVGERVYAWHGKEFDLREFCPKHFDESSAENIRECSKEGVQCGCSKARVGAQDRCVLVGRWPEWALPLCVSASIARWWLLPRMVAMAQ